MQESQQVVEPVDESVSAPGSTLFHELIIRKCKVIRGRIIVRGEPETLQLEDAVKKLAPTGSRLAKINVLKLRTGDYVGLYKIRSANFIIRNPTSDGDIRWLLQRAPNFKDLIGEIYFVQSVSKRRGPLEVLDAPSQDGV